MAKIDEIIQLAREYEATDIYMTDGMPLMLRVNGKLERAPFQPSQKEVEETIYEILNQKKIKAFDDGEDLNVAFSTQNGNRQRIHVFRQRKRIAAVVHLLSPEIPDFEENPIFPQMKELLELQEGLILIAGNAGSGRTTTAISMLEYWNRNSEKHMLMLENPVEYLFKGKKSLIHQRETGRDVISMSKALRSAMFESCDVIFVSEIPDFECLQEILRLVEAGNLVIAIVNIAEAKRVQSYLSNLCPKEYRGQIESQLESYVKGIIQQKLVINEENKTSTVMSELMTIED